jgi:ankyrin repeat protein
MKHILITTIAAVVLVVGCGESQKSAPAPETKPVEPVAGAKAPDISIHKAAGAGNIEAVKQHLAAGTKVDAKNDRGRTPLYDAAYDGHQEIVELLITAGADVNANSDNGTPLDTAIRGNYREIADLLLKHGGKYGSIRTAAGGGDIEAVKEFLAAGADVNAKSKFGRTPLHYAAGFGQKETAELLIAKGVNVNAKNEDGETPLDRAIINDEPETADLLRKHGGKTGEELKAEGK